MRTDTIFGKYIFTPYLLELPASMMRHGGRTYSAWETAEAGRVTNSTCVNTRTASASVGSRPLGCGAALTAFAHLPFGVTWTIG